MAHFNCPFLTYVFISRFVMLGNVLRLQVQEKKFMTKTNAANLAGINGNMMNDSLSLEKEIVGRSSI